MDINKTIVIDCGKCTATYYDPRTDKVKVINNHDILTLHKDLNLEAGWTIVGEASHLATPRGDFSLSQPFLADELLRWYKCLALAGIDVRMFPQKSTPRAYAEIGKSDATDPLAIWKLLKKHPEISMMKPPKSFDVDPMVQEYWDWKDLTNKILNVARWNTYNLSGKDEDLVTDWILDHFEYIYNNLSENAIDCFGITKYKVGGSGYKKGDLKIKTQSGWSFSMPQIYSVLAAIMYHDPETDDLKLRLRESTGNFPKNYHFKRYILCATPFHFRGGVLRSNEYYHGARNWIIDKAKQEGFNLKRKVKLPDMDKPCTVKRGNFTDAEDECFVKYRQIYIKSVMELYSLFKKMLQEEHNLPLHSVQEREFITT